MKAIKFFILAVLTTLVLAACGQTEDKTAKKADKPETSYTVEHAMGSTTIKGTPKRVVILTNEGTESLLAMGVKPVGAVKSFTGNPWYDHIADQMKDVQVVGVESEMTSQFMSKTFLTRLLLMTCSGMP